LKREAIHNIKGEDVKGTFVDSSKKPFPSLKKKCIFHQFE
jgi:hypothetical protein